MRSFIQFALIFLCFVASLPTISLRANEQTEAGSEPQQNNENQVVTIESIDTRLKELESLAGLDETTLASARELYQQARLHLQSADKLKTDAANYQQKTASVADDVKAVQAQLDTPSTEGEEIDTSKNLAELQTELAQKTTELANAREQAVTLSGEPSRRQTRLLELPQLVSKANSDLKTVEEQLKQAPPASEPPAVTAARTTRLLAQKQLLQQEIATYEAERQFFAATTELLPMQTELLQRQVERLTNETSRLTNAVGSRRESDIEQLQRRVNDQMEATDESLKQAAQLNVELVEKYVKAARRLGEVNKQLETTQQALELVKSEFQTSRERVNAVGLNDTLGLMLRTNKAWLTNQRRRYLSPQAAVQKEIRELQVELFQLQDRLGSSSETDASISRLFDEYEIPAAQRDELRSDVGNILDNRRAVLGPLIQTKTELFNQLVGIDTAQRSVVQVIDDYLQYINEHVLWIRSGPRLGSGDLQALQRAVYWTIQPSNRDAILEAFWQVGDKKLPLFLLLASAFGLLSIVQRRLRRAIQAAGEIAQVRGCHKMVPTLVALTCTLLVAAFWPTAVMATGWLFAGVSDDPFVQALAWSLMVTGLTILPFEVLRQTCRGHGLAESHFDWADTSRKYLRSNLHWLVPVLAVFLLLINLMQYQPVEEYRNSLGRLLMIGLLLVLAVYIVKLLHPNSLLYREMSAGDHGRFWYRFRFVQFTLAILIVAGLMLFTLTGYYYTTWQLGSRLLQTNALIIFFVIVYETSMRWLLMRRRKMKLEQLAARRAAARQQPDVEQSMGQSIMAGLQVDSGVDANTVSKQAKEILLVVTGFIALSIAWQIWVDIIPAVGILNRIELWPVTIGGVVERVTLRHLLMFVLAIAATLLAVKNIPGMLELLLLRRLPMDAGSRFAVETIARYVVGVIGLVIAFSMLKIQWGQFAWMVAAISVGLGFGLQEIVANFVCGLILLLERPVRIGDIVTIEGTTGVVTRIQMRATTVTNFDQQDLVIPNKSLITGSIFNWTLTNVITRVTVEFGVAYGTDPELIHDIVLAAVRATRFPLEDPPPNVTFDTFGDSSLNFKVRCCIDGPDQRLAATHAFHVAINKCLAEHKIEIPFPQRVIHTVAEKHAEKFQTETQKKPQ